MKEEVDKEVTLAGNWKCIKQFSVHADFQNYFADAGNWIYLLANNITTLKNFNFGLV